MKARTVALRPRLAAVVGAEVVALAAFTALPPGHTGWWPAAAITAAAVVALVVTVHRRNAAGWIAARARWLTSRRAAAPTGAAVDVAQGSIVCGVRTDTHEAITMIRVTGRPDAPTFLRTSTVSHTANVLPLRVLVGLLDQPGDLHLGIDVVSAGHRVRRGTGYPALYSTLLADRPAAGQRSTRLVVRLDIPESVPGLAYRRSIGAAAAAATERIINALFQEGIRASVLGAAELDAALAELGAGLAESPPPQSLPDTQAEQLPGEDALVPARAPAAQHAERPKQVRPQAGVGWRAINAHPGYLSSYYFSPEDITTAALHQMWSLRTDHVVTTVSLRKHRHTAPGGGGPVLVSALVRTNDPQAPQQPPTLFLNPLPGEQYAAALLPAPIARPRLALPTRVLDDPDDLQIPIGPTGILVGAALHDDLTARPPIHRDDLVMWPITDPARATRITMDTSQFYVRQLLIRAAATGERIAIYSHQPSRWQELAQPNIAVVARRRPAEFVPTIIVNDRPISAPSAGLSSTVITLGKVDHRGPEPDVCFEQTSRSTVRIIAGEQVGEVAIVVFRQEQAFTG
ncbi:MAG: type VII secretion protein EccE [Mycobacterium sp.]|nr:type VII secretion protein EccE [Mycobacterium sp.]MBV9720661.1 type VII secretion protein EccE [Mycobacterium sp.]